MRIQNFSKCMLALVDRLNSNPIDIHEHPKRKLIAKVMDGFDVGYISRDFTRRKVRATVDIL